MLISYINEVQPKTQMADAFLPTICGPYYLSSTGPRPTVPTLWVNSESESVGGSGTRFPAQQAAPPPADGPDLRYWEIAGASHLTWWTYSYVATLLAESETNGAAAPAWNPQDVGQYGERGGGPCPKNHFPDRYAYHAALHWLGRWLDTGIPAPAAARFVRDISSGAVVLDADGNVRGGLRLPPIDVPVATYMGHDCYLQGETIPFAPLKLRQLYPSHAVYVHKLQVATEAAVAKGYLLAADACDLMTRAQRSTIGGTDPVPDPIPQCTPASSPPSGNANVLPTPRRCVSRRVVSIRLRTPRGQRLRRARVYVDGKPVRVHRRHGRLVARVDLRGTAKRTITVRAVARTTAGRIVRDVRRYHTCARHGVR
jgi:hypothetical protein